MRLDAQRADRRPTSWDELEFGLVYHQQPLIDTSLKKIVKTLHGSRFGEEELGAWRKIGDRAKTTVAKALVEHAAQKTNRLVSGVLPFPEFTGKLLAADAESEQNGKCHGGRHQSCRTEHLALLPRHHSCDRARHVKCGRSSCSAWIAFC